MTLVWNLPTPKMTYPDEILFNNKYLYEHLRRVNEADTRKKAYGRHSSKVTAETRNTDIAPIDLVINTLSVCDWMCLSLRHMKHAGIDSVRRSLQYVLCMCFTASYNRLQSNWRTCTCLCFLWVLSCKTLLRGNAVLPVLLPVSICLCMPRCFTGMLCY